MGYLICQDCGGYYKLREGESPKDFVSCQCYGTLVYVEDIDENFLTEKNLKVDSDDAQTESEDSDKSIGEIGEGTIDASKDEVIEEPVVGKDVDASKEDVIVGPVVGKDVDASKEDVITESKDEISDGTNEESQDKDLTESKKELNEKFIEKTKSVFNPPEKEPTVKNRAYYRRFDYYSEPDINQLKKIKDVAGLINALYYDDPEVKLNAVKALGVVGDERAFEHLDTIITQESGTLKIYAEIAVNQIKSRKYGFKSRDRSDYRVSRVESPKSINKSLTVKTTPKSPSKFTPEHSTRITSKPSLETTPDSSEISSEPSVETTPDSSEITSEKSSKITPEPPLTPPPEETPKNVSKTPRKTEVKTPIDSSHDTAVNDTNLDISTIKEPSKGTNSDIPIEVKVKDDFKVDDGLADVKTVDLEAPVESKKVDTHREDVDVDITVKSVGSKVSADSEVSVESKEVDPSRAIVSSEPDKNVLMKNNSPINKTLTAPTPTKTITNNNGTRDSSKDITGKSKDNSDIYFIKWLGIKQDDKPIIIFIILFALALIVGVILTMNTT